MIVDRDETVYVSTPIRAIESTVEQSPTLPITRTIKTAATTNKSSRVKKRKALRLASGAPFRFQRAFPNQWFCWAWAIAMGLNGCGVPVI